MDPVGRTKFGVLALGSVAATLILWLSTSFWLDAQRQYDDARRLAESVELGREIGAVARELGRWRTKALAALSDAGDVETAAPFAAAPGDDALVRLRGALRRAGAAIDAPAFAEGLPRSPFALRASIDEAARLGALLADRHASVARRASTDVPATARARAVRSSLVLADRLVAELHALEDGLRFDPRVAIGRVRGLQRLHADARDFAEAAGIDASTEAEAGRRATALAERLRSRAAAPDTDPALADAVKALVRTWRPGLPATGTDEAAARLDGRIRSAIEAEARRSAAHGMRRMAIDTLLILVCFWIALASLRLLKNVQHQGWHDRVTDLPNRFRFEYLLERALDDAARSGTVVAALVLDVDRFTEVNASAGHGAGDALLRALGARLAERLGERGTLAALGGDEFAAVLPRVGSAATALAVAETLRLACREPFEIGAASVSVTLSVGVALPDAPGERSAGERGATAKALLGRADVALRRAKDDGRDRGQSFDHELAERERGRMRLERELRRAVPAGELELHYQPKVGAASGRVDGLEALVRWRHPERGLLPPGLFVPLAERSGSILAIGDWVLAEAVRRTAAWHREGLAPLRVAVNVSAEQFLEPGFVERVTGTLARHGLAPDRLELEVTESVAMGDVETVIDRLGRLRALGVSIAVDDFGTGYSSLQYLERLPLDVLKIDRAFVAGLAGGDRSLVRTIVSMARSLELATVAEGVETPEQLARVLELGCDSIQGYLYSRPVPADEVPATVARIEAELASERAAALGRAA